MNLQRIQEYVRADIGRCVVRIGERRGKENKIWLKRNGSGYKIWVHVWLVDFMW